MFTYILFAFINLLLSNLQRSMNDAANDIYSDDFIKLYTKFANNSFVGSRKSLLISKIKVKTVKIILS